MRLTGDLAEVGPYRILGRLGEGGMGTVYLAADPRGREVAVKVVRPDLALDDQFRRRFRSEVNRARQVPPFCTAEVLDADPYHDPPYLVVEYIDGPNLFQVVRRQGPLGRTALHSVAVGIATALTAIHGAGVVHRDLKPGNVLFGLGGIKVIDFGIARALDPTSMHTRTNQMMGTVSYMAPERFDHESVSRVGTPADVFAWGAVVAFAGTGRTPFGAESPAATAVRILTSPPELTGLDEPMRGLVERALAKDPAARPTTRELLDELLATAPQPQTPFEPEPERSARADAAQPGPARDTPFLREVVEAAGRRPEPRAATPFLREVVEGAGHRAEPSPPEPRAATPATPPFLREVVEGAGRRPEPEPRAAAPFLREVVEGAGRRAEPEPRAVAPATAPFLREVVEAAADRRAEPSPPEPRAIPMATPPLPRRTMPGRLGALRRFEVAASAAVVLAVTTVVVVVLGDNDAPSPGPSGAADRPATAASALADPAPPPLGSGRRVALRLAGTNLDIDETDDRRATLTETAEPTEFVLQPAAGSYRIKSTAGRCLNAATTLTLGACTGDAALLDVRPEGDAVILSHPRAGAVRWSEDRAAIVLDQPGGGTEPARFTLIDRGPA